MYEFDDNFLSGMVIDEWRLHLYMQNYQYLMNWACSFHRGGMRDIQKMIDKTWKTSANYGSSGLAPALSSLPDIVEARNLGVA